MDDSTNTKGRIVVAGIIWFVILGIIVLAWRIWWSPRQKEAAEKKVEEEKQETILKTSAPSRFKNNISFAADSFSGYAAIRSSDFQDECSKFATHVDVMDDGADYPKRLKLLADGKVQMGVFTIDALIKASAQLGSLPATIVAVIDETKGADAMVASKKLFPNIDALNQPEVKIICTPDSPSETLSRVVMAHFTLNQLGANPFEPVNGPNEVWNAYKKTGANEKKVFVAWEPYVSRMLDNPEYHVLVDSSKFRGYIVDVIVANRSYLLKNEEIVEGVVKAYLTTIFKNRNQMVQLVAEDAKQLGEPLKPQQADRLVKTIWWKNTQENFGHFGLTTGHNLQHLESICINITGVLQKTGAIKKDPSNGQPNLWYYDKIMRKLSDTGWYPGFGQEAVREEKNLLALSEEEWKTLRPIGTLQVPRLVFARGTSRLTDLSFKILDELVESLKTWPQYYLAVRGGATGQNEADKTLAEARAKAAMEYLVQKGVDRNRIHSEAVQAGASTVTFTLGELPY